jgi:predicted nucleic acid-binding protein
MTVANDPVASEALFLDTSLIIPATVAVHPAHAASSAFIDAEIARGVVLCISPQVCREFLVVLTRQPVSDRVFETREALSVLQHWTTGCRVLEENELVLRELLSLVEQFNVRGKQVHDCNIVATMRINGIGRLATRNASDFKRYASFITVDAIA